MNEYTKHKELLEAERSELEQELTKLGIQNPADPSEWSLKKPDLDILPADENEVADKNEELHVNSIILDELSARLKNVLRALNKLESNSYGVCEICGEAIEAERLLANPAARTCKAHVAEGDSLN